MSTTLYISKIEEHLAIPSTYKELKSDLTQVIRNYVLSITNYFRNVHQVDNKTRHHLTLPKPACTPLFYCLPKVHKPNIPLQPIVYQHVTASLSTFKLCHQLHITSWGDIPLIHPGQKTLSTAP